MSNPVGLVYNTTVIKTERLYLRLPFATDCPLWIKARQENYDFLQHREPIWDMDHLTYIGFNRYINDIRNGFHTGNYYNFMILNPQQTELIGSIEVANVLMWPKLSAVIGYWISQKHNGKGYMTEVIQAVSGWCFNTLGLKRVEAATMINNPASQKVLLKNGFELEGYQKCFAEINGKFEDHYFFGLVASEFNSA